MYKLLIYLLLIIYGIVLGLQKNNAETLEYENTGGSTEITDQGGLGADSTGYLQGGRSGKDGFYGKNLVSNGNLRLCLGDDGRFILYDTNKDFYLDFIRGTYDFYMGESAVELFLSMQDEGGEMEEEFLNIFDLYDDNKVRDKFCVLVLNEEESMVDGMLADYTNQAVFWGIYTPEDGFCAAVFGTNIWTVFTLEEEEEDGQEGYYGQSLSAGDGSTLSLERNGTFMWYQKEDVRDDNYRAGFYEIYVGEDAVEKYCEEMMEWGSNISPGDNIYVNGKEVPADQFCIMILYQNEWMYEGQWDGDWYQHSYIGAYNPDYFEAVKIESLNNCYFEVIQE